MTPTCLTLGIMLATLAAQEGPSVVRINREGGRFTLLRDGQPYFIKGAVGGDPRFLPEIARAGGNSVRGGVRTLDQAGKLGLTVLVNLPVGNPRRGFDYTSPEALDRQRAAIREIVLEAKGHPAVLMWALGNELEIHTTAAQREPVYRALNDLARLIHEIDGQHPVMTIVGGQYKTMLHEVQALAPDLDLIGLNAYADMFSMPEDVAAQGWDRPYVVTEFGPRGHWQAPRTPWGMPIEQTSTEKAAYYQKAYQHAVADRPHCLGAYVFYWSYKQEKTHTWYGLFLADGRRTGPVDTMRELWTGRPPANRCPRIAGSAEADAIALKAPTGTVKPGTPLHCHVQAEDPDGDPITVQWELRPDVADDPGVGGDFEPPSEPIPGAVVSAKGAEAVLAVPDKPGHYRIFVVVDDGHGSVATANRPIQAR